MSLPHPKVFAHINSEQHELYRAILSCFVASKERFQLHLRPEELWQELRLQKREFPHTDPTQLQSSLNQLVTWGNLLSTLDAGEVKTVEDFHKKRFLYQLSQAGEAAEAALTEFVNKLEEPGELQTAALTDILEHLSALSQLLKKQPRDIGRFHRTVSQLFQRFNGLAEQARSFLSSLKRSMDFNTKDLGDFLNYKEHLINYVERFLRELTSTSGAIVTCLEELQSLDIQHQLLLAADRDLSDRLRQDEQARTNIERKWLQKWDGMCAWFIGSSEKPPQSQLLRAHTRSALTNLLQTLENIHDSRLKRSDRVADWRQLARWFATSPDDRSCHALYHQAFGLSPTRHLMIDSPTLDERDEHPVPPATPWLEDRPMLISPRLREKGRIRSSPGKKSVVVDHGLVKLGMKQRLREEAEALRQARTAIANGQAKRLSEFRILDPKVFDILLDCLGTVLAQRFDPEQSIHVTSSDGSLEITCTPTPGHPEATLEVPGGQLKGLDLTLCIEEKFS